MAITRRQFIKRSGLAAAGTLVGPSLFRNPFVRRAFADTIGDRYLLVVFLDGGNDGLNTVTPIADGSSGSLRTAYQAARSASGSGGLRLSAGALGPVAIGNDPLTATPLAVHPGLVGLKNLYDLGKVAVIQGCGYPDYNLSHEISRKAWESGNPLGAGGYTGGWVGRHLAMEYGSTDIPAVNIRGEVAGELLQSATSVLAVDELQYFGFPYDNWYPEDDGAKHDAFGALYGNAATSAAAYLRQAGIVGSTVQTATESYANLHDNYVGDRSAFNDAYDNIAADSKYFSSDLREVAKVIYGVKSGVPNVNARFFEVRNGGYDTHSDQGAANTDGQHYQLHREVGDAIEVFYNDCLDMGVADKLCIVVWSEFSRRIEQNDNGTDHGSQGPVFVIGGINGGVYGNHPDINSGSIDDYGNTVYSQAAGMYRSTDFRDVYGTILKHWLNIPQATILSSILPLDSGDPSLYWTVPSFDMGFLGP